jgi:hypothetical protein
MKKFTLMLFVVAFCIYIYNCKPELVSKIISNEGFENLDLNLKEDLFVNMDYEAYNNNHNIDYDNKYWEINNNYGLLDKSFIKDNETIYSDNDDSTDIKDKNGDVYPYKNYNYNNKKYNLLGLASNTYYNIYYIIYEKELNNEYIIHNNKLYEYILVKKIKNKINVVQIMQPRNKINMGDYINLYSGPSELSHILISPIN